MIVIHTVDGVIRFEEANYSVLESVGFVEVCVVFFQPDLVQFEDNNIVAHIQTVGHTAIGSLE